MDTKISSLKVNDGFIENVRVPIESVGSHRDCQDSCSIKVLIQTFKIPVETVRLIILRVLIDAVRVQVLVVTIRVPMETVRLSSRLT